mmetsp:Transcript_3034/g.7153  ORF Transcript_3034/g.7153 Transcript_3034/m.7153 type:complete len:1073 (+) Transcript_3034:327-3545(+)|eukprot:CAMPEP_0116100380 /NCGR_PEP_ID=MMETSP0327-20121206/12261_1 /TAXON_ID=44447 /ORGANISM="Pseudo-nitzschia delicatissima, Strain B596" /LENGTH=1072 /DNA_ID=CAMNT_0003592301 /DNA_START=319 /DNA_END=3537 /DNA_ORIENTATION=+
MGLFKKIFKGKKKNKEEDDGAAAPIGNPSFPSATASESRSGGPRNGKGKLGLSPSGSLSSAGSNQYHNAVRYNMTSPRSAADNYLSPRSTGPIDTDDEGVIVPDTDNIEKYYEKTRNLTQDELRIAYEMSKSQRKQNLSISDSSGDHDDLSSAASPRLTSNQLKQWDRRSSKQQQPYNIHQQYSASPTSSSGISPTKKQQSQQETLNYQQPQQRVYTMSSALPSQQQFKDLDDMNVSESDASSFNLSTDAEDSEYEIMKRSHMPYPPGNIGGLSSRLSALDTSAIDTVGSITSYTTDEDRKIFPNLPTDDEMTLGTEASSKAEPIMPPSLLLQPMPNPLKQVTVPHRDIGHHNINANIESNHTGTADRGMENVNNLSNDSSIIKNSMLPKTLDPSWNYSTETANQPSSTKSISRNKPGGHTRNFTSPKSTPSSNTDFLNSGFGSTRTGAGVTTNVTKNTDFSNDGFGSMKTNDTSKFSNDDGFGTILSGIQANLSKKDRNAQSKNIAAVDDTGFADFGDFADFGEFSSSGKTDKSAREWATVKEEKKDPAWEEHNHEFFNNASPKNTESNSPFGKEIDAGAWNVNGASPPSAKNNNSADDPFRAPSAVGSTYLSEASSSSTGFQSMQDRSLTELLEAAKSKRKDRKSYGTTRDVRRPTSSSVNSAPAITSSYLRQRHNLGGSKEVTGASNGNSYGNNNFSNDRAGAEGTSLSDIISSLEATDRMKQAERMKSHRSMGDAGVVATARAAKERLRERRRRERDLGIGRNNSDSEESEDNKNSDSWLFDQVTGAIGPAGIAADLESLSGRSKNSHGGKSHRSSSVAGSRRKSSGRARSRRQRSDRSVDSHGSRTSRYSHRSTKSFLSQMSEQSRSVANDLLRLEMQLAMVGNNKDADGLPVAASSSNRISSGASLGGASRTSARSGRKSTGGMGRQTSSASATSSVVRRSKATIVAPPGKLGIILANKADSKGTVVSGVRTSSVLVDRISPGDRIIAIDGEDVSRMTVSEITTIMSRKSEYERRLTVLTASAGATNTGSSELRSPTQSRSSPRAANNYGAEGAYSAAVSTSSYRR